MEEKKYDMEFVGKLADKLKAEDFEGIKEVFYERVEQLYQIRRNRDLTREEFEVLKIGAAEEFANCLKEAYYANKEKKPIN